MRIKWRRCKQACIERDGGGGRTTSASIYTRPHSSGSSTQIYMYHFLISLSNIDRLEWSRRRTPSARRWRVTTLCRLTVSAARPVPPARSAVRRTALVMCSPHTRTSASAANARSVATLSHPAAPLYLPFFRQRLVVAW